MASTRGIHDRLNHVSHWDVNVSDLERSRAWYEAMTNLRVVARTESTQGFPGLGISGGSFEGYMMKDKTLPVEFPMIHLVQWKTPRPVGSPYQEHTNVGWYRIIATVVNLDEARQKVLDQGGKIVPEVHVPDLKLGPSIDGLDVRAFTAHDPDGIPIEFASVSPRVHTPPNSLLQGLPSAPLHGAPKMIGHNTARLESNMDFYLNVLGLDLLYCVQTSIPTPNVYNFKGGEHSMTGAFLTARNSSSCFFDWLQWDTTAKHPTPYAEQHHLGIIRCALEVDDVATAHRNLVEAVRAYGYNDVAIPEPEEWDFGPDLGVRRVLNFCDPEGVAFQLIQQPGPAPVALHPWGRPDYV